MARLCRLYLQSDPQEQQALLAHPIAALHNTGAEACDERLSAAGQCAQHALMKLSAQCQHVVQRFSPARLEALTAAEWLILAPQLQKARQDTGRVQRILEQPH